jgi:hypothetical protein
MKRLKFNSLKGLVEVPVLALSSLISRTTVAQEQISKNVVLVQGVLRFM